MSSTTTTSRRRKSRKRTAKTRILRLCVDDHGGKLRWVTADLLDASGGGVGVATAFPLAVGTELKVNGRIFDGDTQRTPNRSAKVCWCLEKDDGSFRAGLALEGEESSGEAEWHTRVQKLSEVEEEQDHYEVLQLSRNAHPDTVQRVYRMLAQRYHPDNSDTGNEEVFKKVLEAYRVLKDAETRAAFDARHDALRRARWRVFESAAESRGVEGEKRKRQGILALLYARRMNDPDMPTTTIHDLEDLLGCPRDHLQISLWYLKEKGFILRDDRGRYSITADGVDESERQPAVQPEAPRLLTEGHPG